MRFWNRERWARPRTRAARGAVLALALIGGALAPGAASAQQILTADDAVRLALQRNPSVGQAAQEIRAASGTYAQARSQVLPQLGLSSTYQKSSEPSPFFTPGALTPEVTDESTAGNIQLSQTLISFPAWGQLRSAARNKTATMARNQTTRADIALGAYRQFYALLKAYKLARVTQLTLQLTQDQLKRTQALFELGSVARGDVLKQQVQVSQAQLDDITARTDIVVQRALLAGILGLDVGQTVDIDTTLTEIELDVDSASVFHDALARRPELADFRARLKSAQANLGAAQGGRYPSMNAALNYTFRTPGFPKSTDKIDSFDETVGSLSLRWAVFDGFFSKGKIREARARKLQAEYALRATELDVIVQVQQALQAASQARDRIHVARDGLDAAQEDLKLTQEKYNVGSATVIELIDSQVALTRASVDYINAVADAHIAQMQLRRARGESF